MPTPEECRQMKVDAAKIFCRSSAIYLNKAYDESIPMSERFFCLMEAYNHTFNALFAADKALQSLTPGGSEYVADYDRCVDYVKGRVRGYQDKILDLIKQRNAMQEEIRLTPNAKTLARKDL